MRGIIKQAIVLTWTACVAAAGIPLVASSPQTASGGTTGETLPKMSIRILGTGFR